METITVSRENREKPDFQTRNLTLSGRSDKEDSENCRRKCGCLRTSDKLKNILKQFPLAPPPTPLQDTTSSAPQPSRNIVQNKNDSSCISAYCVATTRPLSRFDYKGFKDYTVASEKSIKEDEVEREGSKGWRLVSELAQLLQLSITATALIFYYIIYCYMQFIYFTLKSALYFHQADGAMKVTIGIVTVTSLILGFHMVLRIQRVLFIH